jgi:hypothetical protein
MGTLRGDNGGERPHEGGGVPDLPPEWGAIVIPDDASELDHEAAALRREWRRTARHDRWRERLRLPARTNQPGGDGATTLGIPLLIMTVAIIATLTSLFALAWPGRPVQHTASAGPAPAGNGATVPDLTLLDAASTPIRLRESLPAVILLVDGCDCAGLVSATSTAAPTAVTVLVVGRKAPPLPSPATGRKLRSLADPNGTLRARFASAPKVDGVVAVLVRGTGEIVRTTQAVKKVDDFRADLALLR